MKKIITVLLGALTVCLAALSVYVVLSTDNDAPVIEVRDSELVYMEGTDKSVLINAVSATDKVDGDVSDSIKIEKTTVSDDETVIRVQFAAKDKNNNISKRTVEFGYTADPNKPVEEVKEKLYNVVLVNNLGVENLANAYAALLRADGHKIVSIGLSTDPTSVETVIYVTNEGDGTELLKYFPNSSIIVGNIENRLNVDATGANAFVILGWQHSIVPTTN